MSIEVLKYMLAYSLRLSYYTFRVFGKPTIRSCEAHDIFIAKGKEARLEQGLFRLLRMLTRKNSNRARF